jgi:hypothetical protein
VEMLQRLWLGLRTLPHYAETSDSLIERK